MKTFYLDGVSPYRKHRGKTFRWIRDNDRKYYEWLIFNTGIQVLDCPPSVPVDDFIEGEITLSLMQLRSLLHGAYNEGREDEHMECYPSIGPSFPRTWKDSETLEKFNALAADCV